MDNIIVSVSDLLERATELKEDGMEYVELSTPGELEDEGDRIPPCLWLEGFSGSSPNVRTGYDEIPAVEDLEM